MPRILTLFAIALCVHLPGQNLLKPANWLRIAPQYQLNYKVSAGEISFNPYCGAASCSRTQRTGVMQIVSASGLVQFRMRGEAGGTGTPETYVGIGNHVIKFSRGEWHIAKTVRLASGYHAVWMTTTTSNLKVDIWKCVQPTLVPVLAPSVDVDVAEPGDPNNLVVRLSTPGHILAASVTSPTVPIPIPGFTHGLHLSPSNLIILGVSGSGGISLDLRNAMVRVFGNKRWPKFYLQAVSRTGFGSRSWF